MEYETLDLVVGQRRVSPNRALLGLVPPELKETSRGIWTMITVLKRRDAPREEEIELASEGVRDVGRIIE